MVLFEGASARAASGELSAAGLLASFTSGENGTLECPTNRTLKCPISLLFVHAHLVSCRFRKIMVALVQNNYGRTCPK